MAGKSKQSNSLVFEYHGTTDHTTTAFKQLLATITDASPTITGFRLELTTTDALDVPISVATDGHAIPDDPPEDSVAHTDHDADTATGPASEDADTAGDAATDVPSLQRDALPARVLSCMQEEVDEPVRTRDLQDEFDDEEIDASRLSQTLASLKRRDLVTAEPDPEDNRANIYWTTDRAEHALAALS